MTETKLKIERPDLFNETLNEMSRLYKLDFDFRQSDTASDSFVGAVANDQLNAFYELARNYSQKLFRTSNQLSLTGRVKKISKIVYEGFESDGFLQHTIDIDLFNNQRCNFKLGILGFSESYQFSRVFSVMNEDDKRKVTDFVGIQEHHFKSSFVHSDFNVQYQIIDGTLIFFKSYNNRSKIELDSLIEVQWTK